MGRLNGKTAVITGGTTGLGFETARQFLAEGARVVITGQNEGRVKEAVAKLGKGVTGIRADVRKPAELADLAEKVKQEFGTVDILFANAGIAAFSPIEYVDEEFFANQFDVNVKGLFFTVQKFAGLLKEGSSVILNASAVNEKGFPGGSIYNATKAAVRSFARSLAAEFGPRGIRVNALSPGYVPTEIQAKMGLPADQIGAFEENITKQTPLGRAGRPEEIAKTAVFLGSDESSYITAADVVVDGGWMNV